MKHLNNKKQCKRRALKQCSKSIISIFLSIVMLLSITAGINFSASAGTGIETKIASIKSKYPNNSYFSKNGKACIGEGKQHGKCSNCQLSKIDSSVSKVTGDGYSCWAFANYAFYKVFGISPSSSSNSSKTVAPSKLNSNAKYGDYVICYNSSGSKIHYFIYLGANGSSHYRYESNYATTNKVRYKGSCPATGYEGEVAKYQIIHASNYDKINNNSVTVTFNGNGGSASKSSLSITSGGTMGDNIPTATRNGYAFDGWYTSSSGGTKYSNFTKINSNTTLYAHWTGNQTKLKSGKVYRITNKYSGLALQAASSSNNALVTQQNISNSKSQLWYTSKNSDGYYSFTNLNGRKNLDIKSGSTDLRKEMQIYTASSTNNNQWFSVIDRSGYYSIHPKSTGRALDIRNTSLDAGAQLQQYYYHAGNAQQFLFSEYTNRYVKFYDNYENNSLPTISEVYEHSGSSIPKDCYTSRDTNYLTTAIDPSTDTLIIYQNKAGSVGKDMLWSTSVNGSYNYDMYNADTSTYYLTFTAKSSVQGAKMYFRWGNDSTSNCPSITLNTTKTSYIVEMPRTLDSGANIHPYISNIDTACKVEINDICLKNTNSVSLNSKNGGGFAYQEINYNVNSNNGTYGYLPQPTSTKSGYIFDGWYTRREGGTKVTSTSTINLNTKLFAHWVKATDSNHTHNLKKYGQLSPTCTLAGSTGYEYCTICNKIITEEKVIAPLGHSYESTVQKSTLSDDGSITRKCTVCGTVDTNTVYHPQTMTLSKSSYTYDGKTKKPSVVVLDSQGNTLKENTDYTVTYASGRKNVGKYSVKIVFNGNYSGSKTLYFTINPKGTTLSNVTAKSKGFSVKWKKQATQTTGYQIQYSTSSDFTNANTVTVSKNTTTSKTISKLKGNKKYYVRIRTYKTVNDKKIYSSWSESKAVTTKK